MAERGKDVHSIFAGAPAGAPVRKCRNCGAESATYRAFCPRCGKRYDRIFPWLSDRWRWVASITLIVLVAAAVGVTLPYVLSAKEHAQAADKKELAAEISLLRSQLTAQEHPHYG